jgi:hypothetical protein
MTHAKLGHLGFDEDEWPLFTGCLKPHGDVSVQVVHEDEPQPDQAPVMVDPVEAERDRLLEAMKIIADFGSVSLGELWNHELADIIRSIVDRACDEVRQSQESLAATSPAPERIHAQGSHKWPVQEAPNADRRPTMTARPALGREG